MIDVSKLTNNLTQQKFENYRAAFLKKVIENPFTFDLIVTTVTDVADTIEQFVGSQQRTPTTHTFPCLYEFNTDTDSRENVGIVVGTYVQLYVSPLQLVEKFGTFKLEKSKIKFVLNGDTYIIQGVTYLLEVYGSCIAVQYNGKLETRG